MHTSSRVSLFVFLFRTSAILASILAFLCWLMTGQRIYATFWPIKKKTPNLTFLGVKLGVNLVNH